MNHKIDWCARARVCVCARLWSHAVLPISLIVIIGLAPYLYLLNSFMRLLWTAFFVSHRLKRQKPIDNELHPQIQIKKWNNKNKINMDFSFSTSWKFLERDDYGIPVLPLMLWSKTVINRASIVTHTHTQTFPAPKCIHFISLVPPFWKWLVYAFHLVYTILFFSKAANLFRSIWFQMA